ncbi:MAG TPA: hypothetical protein VGF32_11055 [Streptosporangiaceae bacterium]
MTPDETAVTHARKVADAILYEGYLLYPYRQSSQKNRSRFQFGVLMPPAYAAVDDSERSFSQTECLLEAPAGAQLGILVRFLHLQERTVQAAGPDGGLRAVQTLTVAGQDYTAWQEATEHEVNISVPLAAVLGSDTDLPFAAGPGESSETLTGDAGERAGLLIRRWRGVAGRVRVRADRVPGPYGVLRLRLRVENLTEPDGPLAVRDDGLGHALIAAHVLIGVPGGAFLSMTDPPEWAAPDVAACVNIGTWPVLAGPRDSPGLMLSSPVILYDHPEIAPESGGDLFDATEIDEILTLRTLALTDAERQEARASDPRAAELIDRLDNFPPEYLERLHGAIRYLSPAGSPEPTAQASRPAPATRPGVTSGGPLTGLPADEPVPWWDPGADTSVSPDTDHVMVAGARIARGSRVRMRPGARRADAQDLFLVGREALVEAVVHDVDGNVHVAVSPASDPVAELQRSHGRYLYFAPDEIEPLAAAPSEKEPMEEDRS